MCTEMQNPITKVQLRCNNGGSLRFLSTQRAKSVIIKLKLWVKKLSKIEVNGAKKSRKNFEGVIEDENLRNENKFNFVKCKMTYTIEELKDIVDDNMANELKEIQSRSSLQG